MIDLHCHTNFSDGTLSPSEVVALASELGLRALALTDHDTLAGYAAVRDAERGELELICGVEIGTALAGSSRSTHILGYFFDEPGEDFQAWLVDLQTSRRERNLRLQQRLEERGVSLPWERLVSMAPAQMGRPHFAALLMEMGYVRSRQEAFDLYLSEQGSAWTVRNEPSSEEAIERIVAAGGVASLAHPVRITRDMDRVRDVVNRLRPAGLGALECFHSEHTATETEALLDLAQLMGLAMTGGSDFHGGNKPGIRLGTGGGAVSVPDECLDALRLRAGVARRHVGARAQV